MIRLLSRLFNIRAQEWPRVFVLYTMAFLFLVGMTWGETVAEASFLHELGPGWLPYMFIADAIITIIAIAIYSAFVDRVSDSKLLLWISVLSALGIAIARLLIGFGHVNIAFPMMYLLSRVVRDTFNLQWWTYANSFYDTRTAKRVIPLLSTAARIAGIFAGATLPVVNNLVGTNNVSVSWLTTLLLVSLGVMMMPILIDRRQKQEAEGDKRSTQTMPTVIRSRQNTSYWQSVKEGYAFIAQSPFLRWMAISTFLLMALFSFLNYESSTILLQELKSVESYSNFLAALTSLSNLIMLPIQLFLLSRIVNRLGLGNTNLLYPTMTLAISGSLILLPAQIATASLAYLTRTTFRTAFRNTIDNLLYNAVPLRVKGRSRAFIGGFIVPLAALVSGILLLALLQIKDQQPMVIPVLIGVIAVGYFFTAVIIRQQYKNALFEMLKQEDFSFLMQSASDLSTSDATTLNILQKKLEEAPSEDLTIFIAEVMSDVGGEDAAPTLIQVAKNSTSRVRASVIDILVAADTRRSDVYALLVDSLSDPDGHVRRTAINGIKQWPHSEAATEQVLSLALELSTDEDIEVRAQVVPLLLQSGDFFYLASAVQTLTSFLGSDVPAIRAQALRVFGQSGDARFIRNLAEYLQDPNDEVRLEAAVAVETLSGKGMPKQVVAVLEQRINSMLTDPIERIRQASLTILGHLNTAESRQTLVRFLNDPSPTIRGVAADALVQSSQSTVPALTAALLSDDPQLRKMAAVVLCRIDPHRHAEVVRNYLSENIQAIYSNIVRERVLTPCVEFRGVSVIQFVLRERNAQLLQEIFTMFAAVHDAKVIKVIAESLQEGDKRAVANALEAIESMTNPQTAQALAPLFDREMSPERLFKIAVDRSGLPDQPAPIVRGLIENRGDSWMRAITLFALGEIFAPPEESKFQADLEAAVNRAKDLKPSDFRPTPGDTIPADQQETRPIPTRNRRSSSLLDALMNDDTQDSTAKKDPPRTGPLVPEAARPATPTNPCQEWLPAQDVEAMVGAGLIDNDEDVRAASRAARRLMRGASIFGASKVAGGKMLSTIEKVIFLKEVPFFAGMTVDQLKILATVCEEELFEESATIFKEGDPGGALYVVVRGRVALEREGRRKGSLTRLGTVDARSYFGEMTIFDNSPRSTSAMAIHDTLTLKLRREPLIALARQYPDMSLNLINVLSQRLRDADNRIAELTPSKSREMHRIFDKLE